MAKKRYTEAERARILAAVRREGLTYAQATKRFGVSGVTIWKWKRTNKPVRARRNRPPVRRPLDESLRAQLRERIRKLLPDVVPDEVTTYVLAVLGRSR